jgi:hypothetical protein
MPIPAAIQKPIIDHAFARQRCLKEFKRALAK